MKRYFHDIQIAFESILANKLKSILTALGIIFGVAAVISMLAIGNGARQEILEQIKMVGVNNIQITPILPSDPGGSGESGEETNGRQQQKKFSRGLTLSDAEAIRQVVPGIRVISPEIILSSHVIKSGIREQAKLIGVSSDYFELYSMPLERGEIFTSFQEEHGLAVCVIGANIRAKFFNQVDPIGEHIKFGNVWLKVIGVLEKNNVSVSAFQGTGINVSNDNVYVPVKTMLLRYQNRALISSMSFQSQSSGRNAVVGGQSGLQTGGKNYHQLDKIIVQVEETEYLQPATEVISRLLLRRHSEVQDFEVTVPELLLKQQQKTRDILNIVLGAIASISLVVGGIGIMNIMFASVMERIKEIGTRLAIGATKKDIVVQFLSEAVLISVSGGIIGVILGLVMSRLIHHFAGILTVVSPFSVIVAFVVSASVGIIFGYTPAKRASEKDPIESLRYE